MLLFLNNHSGVDDWYPTISSCSAALLCHPCRIAQLAGPIIVSQFMNFALNLVSVAFIGRLSEEKMAVAVLATSMMSVTGFSVVMGLLGAMDTLCGQAWGAKNFRALGITLQKAVITTLATTAAICVLWANMEPLLLALGQQEDIAAGAARYLLLSTPALLLAGMFECLKRYLMAQGCVQPVTAVCSVALALSPLFNWLLIFKLGLGIDGAVAAMVANNATMLLLLVAYLVWHERRRIGTAEQTWHGWSRDCLQGLGTYYKLAVPSTLMVCLEWWAYELCIFMAGWLEQPTLHVSAMGVMLQVSGLAYMLPMGLSCATSVRVSNALGAGLPHGARRSANTATACTACTQLLLVAAILLGRHGIGALFTNIPEVVAMCAATFPLMSASMFGDGLNCTISGVLRGAGRQELGALLNLGSYWGLGLPTAYLLAVKGGLELKGLWGGLILATSVQVRAAGRAQIMLLYWTPGRLPSCAAPPGSCSMLAALLLGALSDFHPACVAAPPCRAPSCSSS
ncbi:hypothetical protein CHLNCDRAFT_19008 [Chlorella variabilis]|uniref:Protein DETOXIFICATION n=1 Tax=Chlorella variabilis TaxID=554065 RepID=E1Z4E2_CHLVA|nr:hypothetical protein CHLNCDRAFT_19008 [Chlorella variabilis]EFN59041.1 hypothetical protein CHLNCDRAFT_19008 [Chlorella variabilis]|eukprot:XP_005851143.1 hypothetical protein CHLNCDRAFT_19008 [Chlorella variabilis]